MHHIYIPLHSLDIFGILSQKTSQEQVSKPKNFAGVRALMERVARRAKNCGALDG